MIEILRKIIKDTKKDITSIVVVILPLIAFIIIKISMAFLTVFKNYALVLDVIESIFITVCVSLIISLFIINSKIKKINKCLIVNYLVSFIYIFIILLILNLSKLSFLNILFLSLSESAVGIILVMLTISYANSKESAIKMMSLSSVFVLANILPLLIPGSNNLSLSFVPTLWIGKYLYNGYFVFILWFVMILAIWLLLLFIKFKLSQRNIQNHHN